MTTKKIVFIVVGILAAIFLLVVLFVGGIVGVAFYSMNNSEAAQTAKDFLRKNDRLKQDIGEIKDFGSFISGNINTSNNDGNASLSLKAIGEKRTVNVTVELRETHPPTDRASMNPKGIAILGSTGSIGCNTLRVVEALGSKRFRIVALGAGRNVEVLANQIAVHLPEVVSVESEEAAHELRARL
jgi:hypothetical protein